MESVSKRTPPFFTKLSDVNGRNTGKEIYANVNKVAGEYISYRKVGDHATNMPSVIWYASGEDIKDNIKYKYDKSGNICEITENGHIVAKYAYDGLNRLVREDNKPLNKTVVYTYDNCGNITERCEYAYTRKNGEELTELDCTHFAYEYDGDRLVSYNGEKCAYNNLGSPTTYRDKQAQWQYGTRLIKLGENTFKYDAFGRRSQKNGIEYTYDSDGRLIKQSDGLEFVYDDKGVVGIKHNSTQYFYRRDVQGNIIAILDENGAVVVRYIYDAWGNHAVVDVNGNDIEDMSHIGNVNPFRYRGYYYDVETGLYYLQTRYYDPETGRFISQDSIEYADPESINGLNLYAYCSNNPIMGYDPNGTWDWGIFGAVLVGFVSSVLIAVGAALCATGVGAGAGVVLIGAGIGGLLSEGSSIIGQLIEGKNFSSINWGQVAFNGAIGMAIGAVLASPAGPVVAGFAIAGLTFTQSVGNDLFDNDGDWSEVKWGTAIVSGILSGLITGVGKFLLQNTSLMNKFVNSRNFVIQSAEASKLIGMAGRASYINFWKQIMIAQGLYKYGIKLLTALIRSLVKFIKF